MSLEIELELLGNALKPFPVQPEDYIFLNRKGYHILAEKLIRDYNIKELNFRDTLNLKSTYFQRIGGMIIITTK